MVQTFLNLGDGYGYHSSFTEEETEARRAEPTQQVRGVAGVCSQALTATQSLHGCPGTVDVGEGTEPDPAGALDCCFPHASNSQETDLSR